MDMGMLVPGINKLADYAASGIGSVAGPMLASWRARREANAKLIAAKGEAEAQKILAEGQANTLGIIASAQANARSILVSSDSAVQGQLEFGAAVTQRIQFQEEKRQSNIGQVVTKAALELEGKDVDDHEPDHDWTARFFNDVQDVSAEGTQLLYAKILAGEVERPGNTSIRTLSILRNLDQATAGLFRNFCSVCVSIRPNGSEFLDARVPHLGNYRDGNSLKEYGLEYGKLNILNEHGLITSEYNSWYDIQSSIGLALPGARGLLHIPICFQGKYCILVATSAGVQGKEFRLHGVALTKSGQELSRIIDVESVDQYSQELRAYFEKNNLQMIEVGSWEPQIIPRYNP